MKRSPLKRRTPLRAKTTLQNKMPLRAKNQAGGSKPIERKQSDNAYEEEFKAIKPYVWARSGRKCEATIPGVCSGRAVHVHHRKPRGRGGKNTMANLIDTCFECHAWIHHHPMEATERGMLVGTRDDPETIPVKPWRL